MRYCIVVPFADHLPRLRDSAASRRPSVRPHQIVLAICAYLANCTE